jgi:large subunit ribosomal protein L21
MYAIIQTGGKQYKVEKGMTLEVEKLPLAAGEKYIFENILLVSNDSAVLVGQPYVEGATVAAKVLAQDKDKKVTIFKYKRKTGYRRTTGHRQLLTRLQIEEILLGQAVPTNQESTATSAEPSAEVSVAKEASAPGVAGEELPPVAEEIEPVIAPTETEQKEA